MADDLSSLSSLLPEEEPLTAQDEAELLEEYLLTLDDDEGIVISGEDPPPIGKSWAFDWETRRFQRSISGQGPLETYGEQTLRQWVAKTVNTSLGAHPVHPPGYGVDRPYSMIGAPVEEAVGDNYEARLRDALAFHPRIADIRDFSLDFDPNDDYAVVYFTAVLDDDTAVPMRTVVVAP